MDLKKYIDSLKKDVFLDDHSIKVSYFLFLYNFKAFSLLIIGRNCSLPFKKDTSS